ncbi:hypothetical protein PMAYCL1PPCAC_32565 [Pristionchus mayeri]|uniref:Uncharacterized protein n=1 Tax=Pristionchus mayeri TaxID=1317129 RepID=A0AAN5IFG8_9BILA|nr:hypothetical protein PMAYCL1PPCAC_32565 [Pristionchus mayeri]
MKISSIRKVVHEVAQRNLPLAATVVEVQDLLERRHNLAHGLFNITATTGKTWREIFDEMPDFVFNENSESYFIEDIEAYSAKCQQIKKKSKIPKKPHLLEDELDKLDIAKTITEEELDRRKKAALERDREAMNGNKDSSRGYRGTIPTIVESTQEDEEDEGE